MEESCEEAGSVQRMSDDGFGSINDEVVKLSPEEARREHRRAKAMMAEFPREPATLSITVEQAWEAARTVQRGAAEWLTADESRRVVGRGAERVRVEGGRLVWTLTVDFDMGEMAPARALIEPDGQWRIVRHFVGSDGRPVEDVRGRMHAG